MKTKESTVVLVDCDQLIPLEDGMEASPSECRGAAVVTKLDGAHRVFFGSVTTLYELVAG